MFLNEFDTIPFDAIVYLTGECNYGGKVTDFWDRRVLNTILKSYVNDEVVTNPSYKLSEFDKTYTMPRKTEHREVVKHIIETVPSEILAEVYGLHSNSKIVGDARASALFLDSIYNIYTTKVLEVKGFEPYILEMAANIKEKLPENFDIDAVFQKFPFTYHDTLNSILTQELHKFNVLLSEIRNSCDDLLNVVNGIVLLTPKLDETISSLMNGKIPKSWMKKSYPSLKCVSSYIDDFLERLKFFSSWIDNGKPTSYWISGFFFTHTFLIGILQNYARKHKIMVNGLEFDFEVLKEERYFNGFA